MTVYIYRLSIFRLQPIKKINIIVNLRNYLLSQKEKGQNDLENLSWLFESDFNAFTEKVDMKLVINDKMHFCVRISRKVDNEYDSEGVRLPRHQID